MRSWPASSRSWPPSFEKHPDAEIYRSLPGLGIVLGARVLSEFSDDRTRFAHPKARKNYAGSSPITKTSGKTGWSWPGWRAIGGSPMPATNGPFAP